MNIDENIRKRIRRGTKKFINNKIDIKTINEIKNITERILKQMYKPDEYIITVVEDENEVGKIKVQVYYYKK